MKTLVLLSLCLLMPGLAAGAAEKKMKVEDLPPAVQQTVKAETAHATLVGLSSETDKGQTVYELETKTADGATRDLMIDAQGAVLSVEEEVSFVSIPAPARAAIEAKAGTGRVLRVEKVSVAGLVTYEATVQRRWKKIEYSVKPDGKPVE